MSRLRLPVLLVCALAALSAFARPKMIPITSSFIGASASSNPGNFIKAGSKVFFTANDGVHGLEPWVTDGTTAGTTLVWDVRAGSSSSYPTLIGSTGSAAIFTAYDDSNNIDLWRSDGTTSGTYKLTQVSTLNDQMADGYWQVGIGADTRVFVLVRSTYTGPVKILTTDGTTAGTRNLGNFPANVTPDPVGVNGFLYFMGTDSSVGAQVWVSDGTTVGTHVARRGIECGGTSCGPVPRRFFRAGSNALFLTTDAVWKTDGTTAGTQQLVAISNPFLMAASSSSAIAYLITGDGAVWKTDGTSGGTVAFPTLDNMPFYGPSGPLILDDGRLVFFRSPDGVNFDVWKSDGTTAGTALVGSFVRGQNPTTQIGAAGNRVFIDGSTSATGIELWLADIDNSTVSLLKDIDSRIGGTGPYSGLPGTGIALGAGFLFPATDANGRELWQTDGTVTGTTRLANIAADPGGGVLSGTVRAAADGTPIAGANVVLCAPSGAGACDTVLSDANGRYHFDGVIPGTYVVASNSSTTVAQYYDGINCPCPYGSGTPVTVSANVETSGIDFSLLRGGTISGTIRRASTGLPIPFVQVAIRDTTGTVLHTVTADISGNYRSRGLASGTYYADTAYNTYFFDGRPAVNQVYRNHDCSSPCDWHTGDAIAVTAGAATTGIDFSLHEYGTVAGTVRDDNGRPVPAFPVYFMRQGSGGASASVSTDANGQYVSPLLNPGSYYVISESGRGFNVVVYPNGTCASPSNCLPSGGSLVPVTVDGSTTGIDFQLTPAQSRLAGTIRDNTGAPFSGINVALRDANGGYLSLYGILNTDANGHYDFGTLPAGTYYLNAVDELYPGGVDCYQNGCSVAGATPLVLTSGHSTVADMQLRSRRTTISGRLIDAATASSLPDSYGGGVAIFTAAGYQLANAFRSNGSYQISVISREPSFFIRGIVPGYHSTAYPNILWDNCPSLPCSIPAGATSIPAGTNNNIDVTLRRLSSVSGTFYDAATGQPISGITFSLDFRFANGGAWAAGGTVTSTDGHYVISVPPGSVQALARQYSGYTYQSQVYRDRTCGETCDVSKGDIITVTDGETTGIDFHFAPANQFGTISGHVTDAETGLPMSNVYINAGSMDARTDAQGFYSISHDSNWSSGLRSGQYTMYAEAPSPYYIGLSGGGSCANFFTCRDNGTPVQVTAPDTTTVDFHMIKLRVTSVSPAYGPAAGGTQITIHGANFTSAATVKIGGIDAAVVSTSPTQIVAITPASTIGAAHVTVTLAPNLMVTFMQGFTYLPTATFSDDPLVAGTPLKAAHIIELRTAINNLRAAALLPSYPFSDASLSTVGVKAIHILELRDALNQARASLGLPGLTYTYPIAAGNPIHAVDIAEIRSGVR